MQFLLMLHSIVRWIIVLAALVAIVKFALCWLRGGAFKGMDRGLMAGFSGLMDLQAALGTVYLIWDGLAGAGFPAYRIEHGIAMILAAVPAHFHVRWKKADERIRFRNNLFVVVGVIVLVFIGVAPLPGNRWAL